MNLSIAGICFLLAAVFAFGAAIGLALGTVSLLALAVAFIALGLLLGR